MRVLVCGGRNYSDRRSLYAVLDAAHATNSFDLLIAGGANGADAMAVDWAEKAGVKVKVFRADWEKHHNAAGPLRNRRMLNEGKPELVIAFPGGRGTEDMVQIARWAGIKIIEVTA